MTRAVIRAPILASVVAAWACTRTHDVVEKPEPTTDPDTFERELARRFQYPPPSRVPEELEDPRAGQIADAAYFAAFPRFDRAYSVHARAQAERLIARLRERAGELSHEQFVLQVAEIAALADNAHTAIGFNAFKKNTPRIPLRAYWFPDGLHVLIAAHAHADLLGARIDTIDGRAVEEIFAGVRRYIGGPEVRRRMQSMPLFESPALLAAAGLVDDATALTIAGVRADGSAFSQRILAEARDRSARIHPATQFMLFPSPNADDEPMRSLLSRDGDLPLWLTDSAHLFKVAALPREGLYVRLSHNADADEGPIAPFLDGVLERVRHERPEYVVLDMRMNGGGDYTTTYAFARALPNALEPDGHIYTLTSGWTFSAAITTTAALEQAGGSRATIVGEPIGDRLDFWAEGSEFVLPNAFVTVSYSTGRHDYVRPCTDRDTCFWLNDRYPVRVTTLEPDIAAPLTFAAYARGRDPAMEAVTAAEARRRP